MATKEDRARGAGVPIIAGRTDYRTPCPACSPHRRKKKDPCLHVTVKTDAVLATCFHCDFKGAWFDDADRGSFRPRGKRAPDRPDAPARWW